MDFTDDLSKKITTRQAKVGVVGIGYVGSTIADATSSAGYTTIGFDIDKHKIAKINSQRKERLVATDNKKLISKCDIICICIPTPVNKDHTPNLEFLKNSLIEVAKYLRAGTLITIESSIAPGTTRNFVLPILQNSKLTVGHDFFLAFSPERIDPGNKIFKLKNIPKVVAGYDENSKRVASKFYSSFVDKVIPVSSLEIAEMTKVLENVFRFVNISLINELARYTKNLGIDIWEVIDAASTKPYGFLPHYPGPGIGGDCIPTLSYYLLDSAKKNNILLRIVNASAMVNEEQPKKVVNLALEILNGTVKKKDKNPQVLLVGVSYKPGTSDIRESVVLKIWKMLEARGFSVSYHDPYVSRVNGFSSHSLDPKFLASKDLVIITTAHKNIPYQKLVESKIPLIDTRNILQRIVSSNIFRL